MAVVAHHPVVVQLERVALGRLSVDEYPAVLYLQVVALVGSDGSFIDGDVVHRQLQRGTALRNPHRTVVVARPSRVGCERIGLSRERIRVETNTLHDVRAALENVICVPRQWHITVLIEAREVFHGYSQLVHQLFGNVRLALYIICILHIVRLLVGLSVEIDDAILDLQGLSGQPNATLHIVLPPVGRPRDDVAILVGILLHVAFAQFVKA